MTTRTAFTPWTPPSSSGRFSSSSPPPTPRAGWTSPQGRTAGVRRVTGPSELAFPDYDGNGMFRSLGNATVSPTSGCSSSTSKRPRGVRVNGTATVSRDDPLMATTVGAQLIVRGQRGDLPQLPALHPDDGGGRAVGLCAEARRSAGPNWRGNPARTDRRGASRDRRWRPGANSEWRNSELEGRALLDPATPVHSQVPRLASCGNRNIQMTATATVPTPPITTAGTTPSAPPPSRRELAHLFEAPTKTMLTAFTWPRTASGVQSCGSASRGCRRHHVGGAGERQRQTG